MKLRCLRYPFLLFVGWIGFSPMVCVVRCVKRLDKWMVLLVSESLPSPKKITYFGCSTHSKEQKKREREKDSIFYCCKMPRMHCCFLVKLFKHVCSWKVPSSASWSSYNSMYLKGFSPLIVRSSDSLVPLQSATLARSS